MTRVSGSGYTGALMTQGGITDTALESSSPTTNVTYQGVSFKAQEVLHRNASTTPSFYFARNSTSFDNGQIPKRGFTSTQAATLYIKEQTGNIIMATAGNVTFYYPGITGVTLDGQPLSVVSSGNGWVAVNIGVGTHSLNLVTN